ncbi:MAG: PilZ domain-containing protein [Candidatus Omnitrophica bacterium]|nr:PilZ domain-containing protein [Candidatus Omnitrophota bacterium]
MIDKIKNILKKKEPEFLQKRIARRKKTAIPMVFYNENKQEPVQRKALLIDISETGCAFKVCEKIETGEVLCLEKANNSFRAKELFQFVCETVYSIPFDSQSFRVGAKYTKIEPFAIDTIKNLFDKDEAQATFNQLT